MAGWNSHSDDNTGRRSAYRGVGLKAPTRFQSGSRGDFTMLIPFYFDPHVVNGNWEYHLVSAGDSTGATRTMRFFVKQGAANAGIGLTYTDTTVKSVNGSAASLTAGNHYLAVWVYDHTAGDHSLYLYEEGSTSAISSIENAGFAFDDYAATDQMCIGNFNSTGSGNTNIMLDSPVFGCIVRKDKMSVASLEALWNDGASPEFDDLFPSAVADMAYAIGMVPFDEDLTAENTFTTYKPAVGGASNTNGRLHVWDEGDGTLGANWTDAQTGDTVNDIIDVTNDNSTGIIDSADLEHADPFDTTQPHGSFWQTGTITHPDGDTIIGGNIAGLNAVIAGTRTGTKPLMYGSLGNSRCARLNAHVVDDAAPFESPASLAYTFIRARPARFAGAAACDLDVSLSANSNFYDRFELGVVAGRVLDNRKRAGFGSVLSADGPGSVFQVNNGAAAIWRYDARDPGDSSHHNVQPFIVLLKRPNGAVNAACQSAHHTTYDSSALGTLLGTVHNVNCDTQADTGVLHAGVSDGATSCVITGDVLNWNNTCVAFADDDINYITSVSYDGSNTTLNFEHPVEGAKTIGTTVYQGTVEYEYVGEGDIDVIDNKTGTFKGAIVSSNGVSGHAEVVCVGYYYTDRPNGVCVIVQGWGGNGEGDQASEELHQSLAKFIEAVGLDGMVLTYGTQNVTDMEQHLNDHLGAQKGNVEIIGAPEGAYSSSSFLNNATFSAVVQGVQDFATNSAKCAWFPIWDNGLSFPVAAYRGHMADASHQTSRGGLFRGDLLWDTIEANTSSLQVVPTSDGETCISRRNVGYADGIVPRAGYG